MSYGYHEHRHGVGYGIELGIGFVIGLVLLKFFFLVLTLIGIALWYVTAKHPTLRKFLLGFVLLIAILFCLFLWAAVTMR